jgi:hypothetical protein
VCSSMWSTRPHSVACCVALPTASSSSTVVVGFVEERRNEAAAAAGSNTSRDPRESRGRPASMITQRDATGRVKNNLINIMMLEKIFFYVVPIIFSLYVLVELYSAML